MTLTKRTLLKAMAAVPLSTRAWATDAVIGWDHGEQQMDGFGASAAFHQALLLQRFPDPQRSRVLDLLFSVDNGAGLSIVRNIVGDGGSWGSPTNGPTPTIEPEPGVWNWTGDEDQIWFMHQAARRGCTRYMSTVWSPPAWMKTIPTTNHGGRVRPQAYRQFAEYLSAYVRGYKDHHGIDIYAISPTNEPDHNRQWSTCEWSGEELRTLVRDHIAPVFARDGVAAKLMLGEHSHWNEEPYAPSLADPATVARVDIAAAHAYTNTNRGFEPIAKRVGPMKAALAAGKPIWQTEVSCFDQAGDGMEDALYWASLLHTHVVENQVSGWLYWWALHDADGRGALTVIDPATGGFIAAKRLFAMGNYSRFVRPGFQRVRSISAPSPGVLLSAFRDPAGARHVAVAVNENEIPVALDFPTLAASAQLYRTSAREDLTRQPDVAASAGRIAVQLAPESITSFVMDVRA